MPNTDIAPAPCSTAFANMNDGRFWVFHCPHAPHFWRIGEAHTEGPNVNYMEGSGWRAGAALCTDRPAKALNLIETTVPTE